jgi:hypothetical protein
MNVIGEGSQLTYENFIYVVMSATLNPEDGSPPLVFDVEGTRVFLGKSTIHCKKKSWESVRAS